MADKIQRGMSTRAVHGGESRPKFAHAVATPIVQTATYSFENMAAVEEYIEKRFEGVLTNYEYGRYGNPTEEVAAGKVAELEGAKRAILFASGMAAVTTTVFALCQTGDHIVITDEAYRKTTNFLSGMARRLGLRHSVAPTRDPQAIADAVTDDTVLVFTEIPTNPRLSVVDLEAFVSAVRSRNRKTVIAVDSTFATPYNLRPLEFGADLVIHSCTKYLAGHNDILGGAVCGSEDLLWQVYDAHTTLGAALSPMTAYLLLRGLKPFPLRMARHHSRGMRVAQWLEEHPKVEKVYYPGLPSHPDHESARRQMQGFGGVVSFLIAGDREQTFRFIDHLEIPYLAPSLGGVESLVYHPAALTFADLEPEDRTARGIFDNLVRLSVGIEDPDDLIADLDQALSYV